MSPVQALNAHFPIVFTDSGIEIEVRAVQPSKACWPISVTELGMVIDANSDDSL